MGFDVTFLCVKAQAGPAERVTVKVDAPNQFRAVTIAQESGQLDPTTVWVLYSVVPALY